MEEAVWAAISDALQRPEALVEEYRRQVARAEAPDGKEVEKKQLETALKRLKSQQDRITDAYINEAMELPQYKSQMDKIRERRQQPPSTRPFHTPFPPGPPRPWGPMPGPSCRSHRYGNR